MNSLHEYQGSMSIDDMLKPSAIVPVTPDNVSKLVNEIRRLRGECAPSQLCARMECQMRRTCAYACPNAPSRG